MEIKESCDIFHTRATQDAVICTVIDAWSLYKLKCEVNVKN